MAQKRKRSFPRQPSRSPAEELLYPRSKFAGLSEVEVMICREGNRDGEPARYFARRAVSGPLDEHYELFSGVPKLAHSSLSMSPIGKIGEPHPNRCRGDGKLIVYHLLG